MNSSCPAGCTGMLSTLSPGEYAGIVPGTKVNLGLKGVVVLCKWCHAPLPTRLTVAQTSAQKDADGKEVLRHGDATAGKYRRRKAPGSPRSPPATQSRIQLAGMCPIFLTLCTLVRMARQTLTAMCTALLTLCFVMRILRVRWTIRG